MEKEIIFKLEENELKTIQNHLSYLESFHKRFMGDYTSWHEFDESIETLCYYFKNIRL